MTIAPKARRNETLKRLDEIERQAKELARKLEELFVRVTPEHGAAHDLIEHNGFKQRHS